MMNQGQEPSESSVKLTQKVVVTVVVIIDVLLLIGAWMLQLSCKLVAEAKKNDHTWYPRLVVCFV